MFLSPLPVYISPACHCPNRAGPGFHIVRMSLPNFTVTEVVYDFISALAHLCVDLLDLVLPLPPPPLPPVAFWVPDGQYYVLVDRQRAADGRTQWWPVLLKRPPPLPPVTANKPPPAILRPTDASVRSIVEPRTSDNLGAVAALQMQERDAMLARMRAVFH